MKLKELATILRMSDNQIDEIEVSPEQIVGLIEFAHKELPLKETDYRKRTVNRLMKNRLSFNSDGNIFSEVAKRTISLFCPDCNEGIDCKSNGGAYSGPMSGLNLRGECSTCKIVVNVTMPANAIQVTFKE